MECKADICTCCTVPTEEALECGHACCTKCADNMRALAKMCGKERLCVACYNAEHRRELGEEEFMKLMDIIKEEIARICDREGMERFEAAEREVAEKAERVAAEIRAEGAACRKAIEEGRERQRLLEEKRQMGYAVAEEAAPMARRAGNAGLLARLLGIVARLREQQPGMAVEVEGRFVKVVEKEASNNCVVWNTDPSSWKWEITDMLRVGNMRCGCAVFDPVRRVAIEISDKERQMMDVGFIWIGNGGRKMDEKLNWFFYRHHSSIYRYYCPFQEKSETLACCKKEHLILFNVKSKPMYDNERFVYLKEYAVCGSYQFGRLDLDTMAFERLAHAPRDFCDRNGFFMDGSVFCFDRDNKAMRYDCASDLWYDTSLHLVGECMVAHPWKSGCVIELMGDGSVREVRVADRRVVKTYTSKYGEIKWRPEMLALCAPDGAFFLLVCDGHQPWRVFSSATDSWTETDWPTTRTALNTAFFDPATQSVYYNDDGEMWFVVLFEQPNRRRGRRARNNDCAACHSTPAETVLPCGHRYCEKCAETFTAYSLLAQMANGNFDMDAEEEEEDEEEEEEELATVCVVCDHRGEHNGADAEALAGQVVAVARAAREHDWEGAFDGLLGEVERAVEVSVAGVEAERVAGVSMVRAARDKEHALQKERRAGLSVVVEVAEAMGQRGGAFLEEAAFFAKRIGSESVHVAVEVTDDRHIVVKQNEGQNKNVVWNRDIKSWKYSQTEVPSGFSDSKGGGVAFDPVRRLAIENSWNEDYGKDICVTRLNDGESGTKEVKKRLVLFDVFCKPVYDGERFVYFQSGRMKKHLARLDLDTMTFKSVADAPHEFGETNGFFMDGSVFCFGEWGKILMRYDCASGVWSDTSLSNPRAWMVPHPWQNGCIIELMGDASVREVRIADGCVMKTYTAKCDDVRGLSEMLAVCAPDGAFFLIVCGRQSWCVFSSATDSWTVTDWPTTGRWTKTAFFDPATQSIYYHIEGQDKLSAVRVSQ